MRRALAALVAVFAALAPIGGQACDCPGMHRAVRHHAVMHRVYRHTVAQTYLGCPVTLASWLRPGCDTYYRSYVDLN
ncbi:MAG: hypothetical protein JO258_06110 [Alphaproteobacteria bacterium]|nr:hypothetical protein [Alphaproteobacteria bacterium]